MRVLFICQANVGRSQMAEAFLNKFSKKHTAISAGLNPPPHWEGETLSKTDHVADCMQELGIDVSYKVSKRISEKIVKAVDRIIVLGEKKNWPDYLKQAKNVQYWEIFDPAEANREVHREIRDKIKTRVEQFLAEIE